MTSLRSLSAGNRWLLSRRLVQFGVLALFLAGPWAGVWWVRGSLAASTWFGTVLLADPFVVMQSLAAGHVPAMAALTGAVLVLGGYLLVGGRAYCAWLCPINLVTDAAAWLRASLNIPGTRSRQPPRSLRLWILTMALAVSALFGTTAWELVNPVTLLQRALLFGVGMAWLAPLAVFLFDLLILRRGWCGHVCPLGAFYGLLGRFSLLRIVAAQQGACTDCGECFRCCPEPQVIAPALKARHQERPVILSGDCTNCGRCMDVCTAGVFRFGSRFHPASARGRCGTGFRSTD